MKNFSSSKMLILLLLSSFISTLLFFVANQKIPLTNYHQVIITRDGIINSLSKQALPWTILTSLDAVSKYYSLNTTRLRGNLGSWILKVLQDIQIQLINSVEQRYDWFLQLSYCWNEWWKCESWRALQREAKCKQLGLTLQTGLLCPDGGLVAAHLSWWRLLLARTLPPCQAACFEPWPTLFPEFH